MPHLIDITSPVMTTTVVSPIGLLTLTWERDALTGLHMQHQAHSPRQLVEPVRDQGPFAEVTGQLEAYFAGSLTKFEVPLRLTGTPFQRAVWAALADIPYGETRSYSQIATAVGKPSARRAVGLANGRNPVALIVPCHRVISADGTIGGYGGGLDRKRYLLDLELRVVARHKREAAVEANGPSTASKGK
ncbi:MAG TPA: methylated-DNA--[protein]-cysteine S-methyltransferase [Acidimicrobiales bacterium]|nr:methylated-DNA--[protein]-cysteine S-methyltransferase [Acidimicrobiales bacterium]